MLSKMLFLPCRAIILKFPPTIIWNALKTVDWLSYQEQARKNYSNMYLPSNPFVEFLWRRNLERTRINWPSS